MKNIQNALQNAALSAITVLSLICLNVPSALAAGVITPVNSNYASINIKSHNVKVTIENGFAITQIDQVFHNPNSEDLDATYRFPLPKDAVTAEFTLWIDGQPVTAEVLEKEQARQIYEDEKKAGNQAGLTEKNKQQSFDISVSPIRALQDLKVRFVYIQALTLDHGVGRYVYPLENGGTDTEQTAFWTSNPVVEADFSFDVEIKSANPIEAVRFPQQGSAVVNQKDPTNWTASLSNAINIEEQQTSTSNIAATLDQDIVVYWRLVQGLPGSVDLVTYKPTVDGRGTFMMTFTPGDDLAKIERGIDWTFVLDVSGSMQGKFSTLAEGVKKSLNKFRAEDRFRIIFFNDRANELTQGYEYATSENITKYVAALEQTQTGGGTNLYEGLRNAIDSLEADRTSGIILVTDGEANVGNTEFEHFRKLLEQTDVRLFSFIMGNSANNVLIDRMTKVSNGFSQSVSNSDDIVGQILMAASKITHEAYHDIVLNIDGIKVTELTPSPLPSLYRGQQLVVFGHYWNEGMASVTLSGKVSGMTKDYSSSFQFPNQSNENPEIERLWAFNSIKTMIEELELMGQNEDLKKGVIDLSIEYGLVTDYTSMLIVEEQRFEELGIDRNNQDRLDEEKAAQANRQTQPASNNRVDTQQPMYSNNQAGLGSGAAFNPAWLLIIFLGLIGTRRLKNISSYRKIDI